MTVAVVERDRISEIAETEEIKALRKIYKEDNEGDYADGGVKLLSYMLLGVCDKKVYEGKEAAIYFEILDARNFLKKKYAELSDIEAMKVKKDVEEALGEAEENLEYLTNYLV
ncbi:MAG: hypothetical protein LBV07_04165 [Syntrophobacterales bacterium]|jgi:hypothetical protein|nr:hypothetical protein [Syntrophobacterales bacterium]